MLILGRKLKTANISAKIKTYQKPSKSVFSFKGTSFNCLDYCKVRKMKCYTVNLSIISEFLVKTDKYNSIKIFKTNK